MRENYWKTYRRLAYRLLHTRIGTFVGLKLGLRHSRYSYRIVRADGRVSDGAPSYSFNARVDAGAALVASLISGSTLGGISSPQAAKYLALSTSSLSPAKGDTTLSGETSATGLARAQGTVQNYVAPSVLDGAVSVDIYREFTNGSGGTVTIQSAAVFDASSSGNMLSEANLSSSAALAVGDKLQLTVTVSI